MNTKAAFILLVLVSSCLSAFGQHEDIRVIQDPMFWKLDLRLTKKQCDEIEHVNTAFYSTLIDAMSDKHRKADVLQSGAKFRGECRLVSRVAAKERTEVEHGDPIILVELVARAFGETIGVAFANLVVFFEVTVERVEIGHGIATAAVAASARCSRRPSREALNMTAAA